MILTIFPLLSSFFSLLFFMWLFLARYFVCFFCVSPTCESKAACKFSKNLNQNMSPTATGLGASDRARSVVFLAGGKLLCVLKKLVSRTKHFCFRILVPMSMLTFLDITKTLLYGMLWYSVYCIYGMVKKDYRHFNKKTIKQVVF